MSSELLNHEIWVSLGGKGGRGRGTVKAKRMTMRRVLGMFENPSQDNSISYAEYMKLGETKEGRQQQADRKAAPGFIIAGKFKDGRRKISHQIGRSAIQIDIDYATPEQAEFITSGKAKINDYGFLWHTTRAHCMMKPRIRILLPLSRMVDGDEANALTRYLAQLLADDPVEAIEIPDLVSFRYNQIMYLPSVSREQDYLFGANDAPILDPDEFLAERPEWIDITKLPRQSEEDTDDARAANGKTSMEDPTEKEGLVGDFCRAYGIEEAIETFLSDIYVPGDCSSEIRYTYTVGSAANGLVVYDDLFAYSHHGTDPAEGQNNAWDLVRKHLFIELDEEAHGNTTPGNMPSFKAMAEMVRKDPRVAKERASALAFDDDDFDDLDEDEDDDQDDLLSMDDDDDDLLSMDDDDDDLLSMDEDDEPAPKPKEKTKDKKKKEEPEEDEGPRWQESLTLDKDGLPSKTRHNASLIVTNDRRIAPCIGYNALAEMPYLRKPIVFKKNPNIPQEPIRPEDKMIGRAWSDTDTAGLLARLSAPQSMQGYQRDFARGDVEDAMMLAAEQNRFHPVLEMIQATEWDGVERLGTTWVRFLKAPDTPYIRELEIAFHLAAVARVHEPGHPFHLVPIFGGKQGGGKTGYLKALAFQSRFYGELSGDFSNLQKMVETTRGNWITEMPELKGTHRSLVEDIKQYFTSEFDTVRLAYRRNEARFYRQNVTAGTTNEDQYLKDRENRRFCPVPVGVHRGDKLDFKTFVPLVPQIWAEALVKYQEMRAAQPKGPLPLDLVSEEAIAEARERQEEAREISPAESLAEVIQEWLDQPLSREAVEAGDEGVDDFEGDTEGQVFVRNITSSAQLREALGHTPAFRDLKVNPEKVITQAMRELGWTNLQCRRLGVKRRWWLRTDDESEFIEKPDPSVDDLLDD